MFYDGSMCDTIVATPSATSAGVMLFGKNSDREPDEVQNLVIVPACDYSPSEICQCTYIHIPQVSHTYQVFLSQPFWMWGAEMGANECGVVIGNEALMTKVTPAATGLTGMDLVRLALERADTAKKALDVIIALLETHGQGGQCGYRSSLKYMNGFIIADPKEAFVLETVGTMWAWKQVSDVWAMSNKISLHADFDVASPELIPYAIARGWTTSPETFDFAKAYSNPLITWGAAGKTRETCNRAYLLQHHGQLTLSDFAHLLRCHTDFSPWKPTKGMRMTVCAHATNKLTRNSESVNSIIARLEYGSDKVPKAHYFTTGTSNPCLSPYFPIFAPDTNLPHGYAPGQATYNPSAFWWDTYRVHRLAHQHFLAARPVLASKLSMLEAPYFSDFFQISEQAIKDQATMEQAIMDQATIDLAFAAVQQYYRELTEILPSLPRTSFSCRYKRYWNQINRQVGYSQINNSKLG